MKSSKFLTMLGAGLLLLAGPVSLSSCGKKTNNSTPTQSQTPTDKNSASSTPAEDKLTIVAPTQAESHWDGYTVEQLATESVENKTLKYELEGFKDHYGGMQLSALVRLYSDGYAWQEVYMTVAYGEQPMSMSMYHFGYWTVEDEEISLNMKAFQSVATQEGPATPEELIGATTIALDGDKLAGQAVYSIFTYGTDYAPIEGGDKNFYACIDDFHAHAKKVWNEWKASQPAEGDSSTQA